MGFLKEVYEIYKDFNKERKYAAAKNSPTMGLPSTTAGTVNDEIETSWDTVTERTLALVRDFPIFAGAVASMEAFVIADGLKPQVSVVKNDGSPDPKKSQEIEKAFLRWANDPSRCDSAGKMTLWEMQALSTRMEGEFGEFLFIENYSKNNYSITAAEPTTLDDTGFREFVTTGKGSVIWRGIEYNPKNHKVLAYHFRDPNDANSFYNANTIRVPANRVKHGFKTLRAGQLRGISPFASAILSTYQLRDYMGSELAAQNMSSKWMAWVTAPPSGQWSDLSNRNNIEYNSAYSNYVKSLDYATIEYLKPGESVTLNTQQRSSGAFKEFNETIIRYIAASVQMPYELLSQDYSGLNFTTLRAVRNDFKQHLKPQWNRKISQFCQPVYDAWLKHAVLTGEVKINDYFRNPEKYHSVKWITPTLEQIDPMKEFGAELLKVRSGMKSPQSVIKEMGDDPDKVLEDMDTWRNKVNELDLTFPELTNQNPVISNFEVVEVEEEEETPVEAPVEAPQEEDKEDREFGRDDEGNLYRKVDGLWKPLK